MRKEIIGVYELYAKNISCNNTKVIENNTLL